MAVTSASTDVQVESEYEDTLSYAVVGDTELAKRFVIACGIRISRAAAKLTRGGNSIELTQNIQAWQSEKTQALSYLRATGAMPTPASVASSQMPRVYSVEGYRE